MINRLERIQLVGRDTQDLTENYSKRDSRKELSEDTDYTREPSSYIAYAELYLAHQPPPQNHRKTASVGVENRLHVG